MNILKISVFWNTFFNYDIHLINKIDLYFVYWNLMYIYLRFWKSFNTTIMKYDIPIVGFLNNFSFRKNLLFSFYYLFSQSSIFSFNQWYFKKYDLKKFKNLPS